MSEVRDFEGAVLSILDLPTGPNHIRTYDLELIAPQDLGTAVVQIPAGQRIAVEASVTSLADGVMFSAQVNARGEAECSRCLEPVQVPLNLNLHEMFFTPEAIARIRKESGEEAVADLRVLDSDELPLEEMLRDSLVTAMPYAPVCSEDCQGLCDRCGQPWSQLPADHQHEEIDPRLAKLAALLDPQPGQSEGEE
ncbi:MAG: YceD family protein [Actinomycetaceae bacterium]|nr:YceD family protein [Actinomycetaceae bacterium]